MKIVINNLKHFLITFTVLLIIITSAAILFGVDIDIGDNRLAYTLDGEGPHVFYEEGQVSVNYIKGDRDTGFVVERHSYPKDAIIPARAFFNLDNSLFNFEISPDIPTPASVYSDGEAILAISDIESNYKTFRDFLIINGVVDEQLNWTFGKGHLVLLGDFVDRGFSTTQVLWFIYKLEQEAKAKGGHVHFILGNHEIKNLQGNFQKSAYIYFYAASILGKQQYDLFGENAFLGRWMASKNTMEIINGHLFVHGGLHPQLVQMGYSMGDINEIVRANYRQAYFPKPEKAGDDLLLSTTDGPSWYRGYFEANLTQVDIDVALQYFYADAVVVGHQPQWRINSRYDSRVFAINVKHPNDYRQSFPPRRSEGLLITGHEYFRVLDDGSKKRLKNR